MDFQCKAVNLVFTSLLLFSGSLVAQSAPPPFSAVITVTVRSDRTSVGNASTLIPDATLSGTTNSDGPFMTEGDTLPGTHTRTRTSNINKAPARFDFNSRLYFDGKHRWRIAGSMAPDPTAPESPQKKTTWSVMRDQFIRDDEKHLFFKLLAHPLTPGDYYHQYDVGPASPSIPEAYGFDDWAIYNREDPCLGAPSLTCKKLRAETSGGATCDKWQIIRRDKSAGISLTRTVWIDQQTGITLKSELVEKIKGLPTHHVLTELKDVRKSPQDPTLFEPIAGNGIGTEKTEIDPIAAAGVPAASGGVYPHRKDSGVYTFRTAAREVLVDASVRDGKGRLVTGLKKGDFRVFEDGVEQPIADFWFDQLPIAVALVVDRSGSMRHSIGELQDSAPEVLSGLKPEDKVALFTFDDTALKAVDLTRDRKQVADALGQITATRGTDIVNVLFVASLYLRQQAPDMRKVIILVSDNKASSRTVSQSGVLRNETELIDTALQCEATIYDMRILTTHLPGPSSISMEKITEQTGGEMLASLSARKMLEEVIQTLRNRYVMSFKPAHPEPDGRMHTIELRLSDQLGPRARRYSVRCRKGYRISQLAE